MDLLSGLARFLNVVLDVYQLILVVAVLVSWVSPDRFNPIVRVLRGLTDPVFRWIRQHLPFVVIGPVDLSPIVALLAIVFVRVFIVGSLVAPQFVMSQLLRATAVTIDQVLGLIQSVILGYALIIVIHLVLSRMSSNPFNPFEEFIRTLARPGLHWMRNRLAFSAKGRIDYSPALLILLLSLIWLALARLRPILTGLLLGISLRI